MAEKQSQRRNARTGGGEYEKEKNITFGGNAAILVCCNMSMFPIRRLIWRRWALPPSMIGVILGAYGFTQMAIRMPVGVMADRKNRHKWFIALGVLLAGLASLLRAFVPAAVAFLAANLLSGIASSIWISFTVLFSSYYSPKELTKSMGTITAFNNGGILLGFATGSVVSQTAGIPPLFLLSFLSGMLGFAISLFIKEEKREQAPLPVKELLKVLKSKRLILFAVASATLQAIHMSTAMAFTSQVAEGLGGSNAQIGLCSIIYMVFCIVSSWYVGTRQARRIGNRILMPVFFGCMTVYCALVPLVRSLEALYVLQMIGGLGNASLFSLFMAGAIEGVPKEKKIDSHGFLPGDLWNRHNVGSRIDGRGGGERRHDGSLFYYGGAGGCGCDSRYDH